MQIILILRQTLSEQIAKKKEEKRKKTIYKKTYKEKLYFSDFVFWKAALRADREE